GARRGDRGGRNDGERRPCGGRAGRDGRQGCLDRRRLVGRRQPSARSDTRRGSAGLSGRPHRRGDRGGRSGGERRGCRGRQSVTLVIGRTVVRGSGDIGRLRNRTPESTAGCPPFAI